MAAEPSLLTPFREDGSRAPLFLLHPLDGDPACYAGMAEALGDDQPVFGVRSPGLNGGELPSSRFSELARSHLAAIHGVHRRGPIQLAGWSVGGVIAYEVAQQALAHGTEVETLCLLDSAAPGPQTRAFPTDPKDVATTFVTHYSGRAGLPLPRLDAEVESVKDADLLAWVRRELRRHQLPHAEASDGELSSRIGVMGAVMRGFFDYEPKSIPIVVRLLRARDAHPGRNAPTPGWERFGRVNDDGTVPGTHFTLVAPEHERELAATLRRVLSTSSLDR